jgi:hypothetical protein
VLYAARCHPKDGGSPLKRSRAIRLQLASPKPAWRAIAGRSGGTLNQVGAIEPFQDLVHGGA